MRHFWMAPAVLSMAIGALSAAAQEIPQAPPADPLPWKDVEFRLGLFSGTFRSGLETTDDQGSRFSFNLEDSLDLDETQLAFRLETSVALGRRHRLHLDYFSVHREGGKHLEHQIEIGNIVFPIQAIVETETSFLLIALTYGYSIVQDERLDLALTFGVHGLRTQLEVDSVDYNLEKRINVSLPIPMPGLRFDAVLSKGVWLRQRLDFIWLEVGDYSGLMADYTARLEVQVGEGFSVGVGFNTLNAHLEASRDDNPGFGYEGSADHSFSGLLLYAGYAF